MYTSPDYDVHIFLHKLEQQVSSTNRLHIKKYWLRSNVSLIYIELVKSRKLITFLFHLQRNIYN